jgi:hypothetical protein
MIKTSHHEAGVCTDCAKRHCKIRPKPTKTQGQWSCDKWFKHAAGWKVEEVYNGTKDPV